MVSPGRIHPCGPLVLGLLLWTGQAGSAREASGGGSAPQLPLQCRLGDGPWQDCQMRIEEVGAHWFLLVGDRQIEFRHDGSGTVTMQEQGRVRAVTSRWLDDRSLCWDGTCARGDIPLD